MVSVSILVPEPHDLTLLLSTCVLPKVLTDAAAANTKIALISQTCSDPQDDVITCVINQLPPEVTSHITVYAAATYSQQQQAAADEDADDAVTAESNMSLLNPSAGLAAAAGRVKQRGAQEFVERMTSALEGKSKAVPVQLDLSLQNPGKQEFTCCMWCQRMILCKCASW